MKNSNTGTIITFYSYKGGTGRSMALANIACLIAREQKKRVLVIDWDLEAPGLHRFFAEKTEKTSKQGVIDLFIRLNTILTDSKLNKTLSKEGWQGFNKFVPIKEYIVTNVYDGVDLITAGRMDREYSNKVASFDWNHFYIEFSWVIQVFRDWISRNYDYCLIDSRTGLTDTSGICTALLPEKLVAVFTPNKQSLYGVLEVSERVINYRKASDDFRPITVFPLPSRVDDAEEELRREWRKEYQHSFEDLFTKCYELTDCDMSSYFDEVKLPYKSYYAYGERIAVLLERDESHSMHRAYRNFYNSLINLDQIWEVSDDPMAIVQKGQLLENQGRLSEALEIYQQASIKFENSGDKKGQSIVLHSLGIVYQDLANYAQAIESFNQALEIASQNEDKLSQAVILNDLGVTHQLLGNLDEAENILRRSYDIFIELNDDNGISLALNSLGGVLQRQGKFDEAVDAFQHSLELRAKLGDKSSQASILNSLGSVLQRQGKFDETVEAFQRSLKIQSEVGDNRGRALTWNSLGGVLQRQGKFDEAIEAFQRSLEIQSTLGDNRGQALTWNSLGGVLQRQGKFDEAVEAFQSSLEIQSKLGDRRGQALTWNSLGGVLQRQGKFDDAVEAFQRSYEISTDIVDSRNMKRALNSLGSVLLQQHKFEAAANYVMKAIEIEPPSADSYELLGSIYLKWGKDDEAMLAYQKSLELLEKINDKKKIESINKAIGKIKK